MYAFGYIWLGIRVGDAVWKLPACVFRRYTLNQLYDSRSDVVGMYFTAAMHA
jgi:hypothetical protein